MLEKRNERKEKEEEIIQARAYTLSGSRKSLAELYEVLEMIGLVAMVVMLIFAFFARLNIVDGNSMNQTLTNMDYLIVSDTFYTPEPGDIVVIHDITAAPYDTPIVKRVIATGGQAVEIDCKTWTLKVDGVVIDEPYRYLDRGYGTLGAEYNMDANGVFSLTVPEGEIFVMGDNRNNSGDSRQSEIGTIDERCVVGRAYYRIFPLHTAGKLWE